MCDTLCISQWREIITVSFETKLTFHNCKNKVITIVITVEQTVFTDILQLVIKIIHNVITYVAICDVVISIATYIPVQSFIYSHRFLSAAIYNSCVSCWIATELCLEEKQR